MTKEKRTTKKYAKISEKRRNDLINYVTVKLYSVPKAAKLLKLNVSTAKNIIKIFKRQGRIMDKKMSKKQAKLSKNLKIQTQQAYQDAHGKESSDKKESQCTQPDGKSNMPENQILYVPMIFWPTLWTFGQSYPSM